MSSKSRGNVCTRVQENMARHKKTRINAHFHDIKLCLFRHDTVDIGCDEGICFAEL